MCRKQICLILPVLLFGLVGAAQAVIDPMTIDDISPVAVYAASSSDPPITNTIDRNLTSPAMGLWDLAIDDPAWVIYDMGEAGIWDRLTWWNRATSGNLGPENIDVYTFTNDDPTDTPILVDEDLATDNKQPGRGDNTSIRRDDIDITPINARYIMLWFDDGQQSSQPNIQISEVAFTKAPQGPEATVLYPHDLAVGVPLNVVLRWTAGNFATSHDVYFGIDYDNVNTATKPSSDEYKTNKLLGDETYDASTLEFGETYFWRIDEVNEPTTLPGDVWRFTTKAKPGPCLAGDLSGNCEVDWEDVLVFAGQWLDETSCAGYDCAELDDVSWVNGHDFALLAENWQQKVNALVISEFMASNGGTLIDGDDNSSDWIEIHNLRPGETVDIGGYYLTDEAAELTKWQFPSEVIIEEDGYLVVFASGKVADDYVDSLGYMHTTFKLDKDGEYLALVSSDGQTVVYEYAPEFPQQQKDVSYGLYENQEHYFGLATPGMANGDMFFYHVADTKFSHDRGFYEAPFSVTITCSTPDANICYTTDGSEPNFPLTGTTQLYTGLVDINTTTCLRAAAFKLGSEPSNVDTHTYIFLADVIVQQTNPAGFPSSWNGTSPDYEMDPAVVTDPCYSGTIKDDLKSIPTMSIVMHVDDMFGSNGIYSNPTSADPPGGVNWERSASLELIFPDGSDEGFQINCGIQIHGRGSRGPQFKKHSFRALFKGIYGPTKLNYKLFPDSDVDSFDTIVLRAGMADTWMYGAGIHAQYNRSQWAHDTEREMGLITTHNTFVHLYINGLYWGLYNPLERPDASFMAHYLGGEKEEYDALNNDAPTVMVAINGDLVAWDAMMDIANGGLVGDTAYQLIAEYLDVDNYIDYLLNHFYSGNSDWPGRNGNNARCARHRVAGAGFKHFIWDAEHLLADGHMTTGPDWDAVAGFRDFDNSPARLFTKLRENAEFRVRFGDHAHKHLFNDGALTPTRAANRWIASSTEIDRAIVGESARWGDLSFSTPPTRDDEWVTERDHLLADFFPPRTDIVIEQLQDQGLYPAINAPVFRINDVNQHGGHADTGDSLSIIDSSAGSPLVPLVPAFSTWRYLDNGTNQGTAWQSPSFNDSGWNQGPAKLGYGNDDEVTVVNSGITTYFRHDFTVTDASICTDLTLSLIRDDGAVVYLNGHEVVRDNMPGGSINYLTLADPATGSDEWSFFSFSINPSELVDGENVLAVEIHQASATSSDMGFKLKLKGTMTGAAPGTIYYTTDGNDPRLAGGAVNTSSASAYTVAIPLTASVNVKARVLDGSDWSALEEVTFAVGLVAEKLRITEIMYHPQDTGDPNDPNEEFIELKNVGTGTLNLDFASFTEGIHFVFPAGTALPAGGYLLVVKDQALYPGFLAGIIAGQYTGSLDNGGERIRLEDAVGETILDFKYDDDWCPVTDGEGFSLIINDPTNADPNSWDKKKSWSASTFLGGSRGAGDTGPFYGDVVINEILAHSDADPNDWIELHNTTGSDVNISNWFLSDNGSDDSNLMKYQIPAPTIIPWGGYIVFTQDDDFGTEFALSENGETVYLTSGLDGGGKLTGYRQKEDFGASESSVAFGRHLKSTGTYNFVAMDQNTPGTANAYPKVGPIVISELMYHPDWLGGSLYNNEEFEYVELYNIENYPVMLYDIVEDEPWKFTDGIDFTFSDITIIPAHGYLLVVKNPDAFSERYPGVPAGAILGPYGGKLNNGGEKVEISMPGEETGGTHYYIRVDRVNYSDGSHHDDFDGLDPWPTEADGDGNSLTRIDPNRYGNDPNNWDENTPSPEVTEGVLFINEFMADNATTIEDPDESGEYPDWIELYNAGPGSINLAGMYLTDDLSNPTKWQIPPGVSIGAGGYLIFWADDDDEQGNTHTTFKLSAGGEDIGLFDTDANSNVVIDAVRFGSQPEDVSYGRSGDGTNNWDFFASPTPGTSNP